MLVEEVVADAWRLRRVPKLEAAIYRRTCEARILEEAQHTVRRYKKTDCERALVLLGEEKVLASDRQAYEDAEKRVKDAQTNLDDASLVVVEALLVSANGLSNLWRHEVALSRSMLRMLHEFQRLQAARAGEYVAAPEVVDIDGSLDDRE